MTSSCIELKHGFYINKTGKDYTFIIGLREQMSNISEEKLLVKCRSGKQNEEQCFLPHKMIYYYLCQHTGPTAGAENSAVSCHV